MKPHIFLVILVVISLMLSGCGAPAAWQEFSSDAGKFTVSMPGKPQEQSQKTTTAVGDINIDLFLLENSSAVYMVTYSDYPEQVTQAADPDQILQGAIEGAMKNMEGNITNSKSIKLGDYPGKEMSFDVNGSQFPKGASGKARYYLVGPRLYQTMVLGKNSAAAAGFDKFLDSFKIK